MTIRVEGADELIRKLVKIEQLRHVKASVGLAAIFLKGKVATYPPVRRGPNMQLQGNSEKAKAMRRGFFYHLKRGDIQVPYIRGASKNSEKLGQSWTVRRTAGGFNAIIGTSVSYAQLVQDREFQSTYHQWTGWITTYGVEHLYGQQAINFVREGLIREVNNG